MNGMLENTIATRNSVSLMNRMIIFTNMRQAAFSYREITPNTSKFNAITVTSIMYRLKFRI